MIALILCGMLAGGGLFLLVRQFVAPQPQLQQSLARLHPDQLAGSVAHTLTGHQDQESAAAATTQDKVGAWIERHLSQVPGLGAPTRDLNLLGRSTRTFYGEKGTAALVGLLMVPILTSFGALLPGLGIPPVIPGGFGLIIAAVFWLLPDRRVKAAAAQARSEFVRVTVAYLQLVSIKRSAGGAPVETMITAARISDSWVMVRIRRELQRAQWAGIQPWDALGHLATATDIPEIAEVGDIMRLAGEHGASVKDQLLARAAGLQHRILTDEQAQAQAATTSMAMPLAALFLVFVIAILIPLGAAFASI